MAKSIKNITSVHTHVTSHAIDADINLHTDNKISKMHTHSLSQVFSVLKIMPYSNSSLPIKLGRSHSTNF